MKEKHVMFYCYVQCHQSSSETFANWGNLTLTWWSSDLLVPILSRCLYIFFRLKCLGIITFSSLVFWFPRITITKYHNQGGLNQQKFIFSQFWKLQDWEQGVGRATPSLEAWEEPSCLLAAAGCWQSLHSLVGCLIIPISTSLCTWLSSLRVSEFLLSYKDNSHWM